MKFLLSITIALLWALPVLADHGIETKGFNGLYMGHSFFRPSAEQLDKIMSDSETINHRQVTVFAGGANGSPGRLWQNEKKRLEAQKYLDTKKIDLVVMTYFSPLDSSVQDYSQWIDYAISQNPKTTFMVTIPWGKQLYKATANQIDILKKTSIGFNKTVIQELREKYPDNRILFCPYGLGTYELVERFRAGKLPGVKHILNGNRWKRKQPESQHEQLLNDELGHPSELVAKLGALLWFQTLYEYDLQTLKPQKVSGLPKINLNEIALAVGKKIQPLNAVYEKEKVK
ncbi:hypothetical protein N9B46_03185 [Mariniblastus sp.]|nr:hypothetical protein [Mariniblastus sp.]